MSTAAAPAAIGPIDNTMGAMYIGVILATALYGVTCVQAWFYYNRYQNDPWYMKAMVAFCWMTDTVHEILIAHALYIYLIKNFDNPSELNRLVPTLFIEVFFNGFTALFVQSFFTLRIWRLSNGNIPVCAVIYALVLAEFGVLVAYTIKALEFQTWAQITSIKNQSMLMNIFAFAADVIIAAVMCVLLYRSKTGFKHSETVLNKLMLFSLNTGLLTSLDAIASLVTFLAYPNTFIYICFYFNIGRLYLNSLLATLNARMYIRGSTNNVHEVTYSLGEIDRSRVTTVPSSNKPTPSNPGIAITIQTEHARMEYDEDPSPKESSSSTLCTDDKAQIV